MQISEINPLWRVFPSELSTTTDATKSISETGSSIFGDIFLSAIENVKETDAAKNEAQYLLSVGQLDNPAELTIAASKASTAVELLVQLRNKALDAYSEVMRITL